MAPNILQKGHSFIVEELNQAADITLFEQSWECADHVTPHPPTHTSVSFRESASSIDLRVTNTF